MKMTTFMLAAAAALLAGCVTQGGGAAPSPQDACGAQAHAGMVGAPIAAATFPQGVRVLTPDTIMTQEFIATRLNVLVDAQGVITGFRCG